MPDPTTITPPQDLPFAPSETSTEEDIQISPEESGPSQAKMPGEADDIFAGVEGTPGEPQAGVPAEPTGALGTEPPMPPPAVSGIGPIELEEPASGKGKLIIVSIVIIVFIILGGGALLAWRLGWIVPHKEPPVSDLLPKEEPVPPDNEEALPADVDYDGLSDFQESELGTDPKKPDTDDDGLFDRDEVKVYKTDPLNPDTDADGYPDGSEVASGYDPTRAGARLFDIPGTE